MHRSYGIKRLSSFVRLFVRISTVHKLTETQTIVNQVSQSIFVCFPSLDYDPPFRYRGALGTGTVVP